MHDVWCLILASLLGYLTWYVERMKSTQFVVKQVAALIMFCCVEFAHYLFSFIGFRVKKTVVNHCQLMNPTPHLSQRKTTQNTDLFSFYWMMNHKNMTVADKLKDDKTLALTVACQLSTIYKHVLIDIFMGLRCGESQIKRRCNRNRRFRVVHSYTHKHRWN